MDSERLKQLRLRIDTEDPMFPGLKRLKVGGRDLQYLPREVFSLAELEILSLTPERESCLHFKLYELPSDIAKMVNLKVLMLDTNELEQLPDRFFTLNRLERISLSNNYLTALPKSFSKLQSLKSLHLANNQLSEFPAVICELTLLEFVDVSGNRIESMPREISNLFNLHTLIMYNNNLKELPDTICGMTSLHTLWLGDNYITKLPSKFGQLINLDWGSTARHMLSTIIDGNPLKDPPIAVCRGGVQAIGKYFGDNVKTNNTTSNPSEQQIKDNRYKSPVRKIHQQKQDYGRRQLSDQRPKHLVDSKQSSASSITSASGEQVGLGSRPQFKGRGRFNHRSPIKR